MSAAVWVHNSWQVYVTDLQEVCFLRRKTAEVKTTLSRDNGPPSPRLN